MNNVIAVVVTYNRRKLLEECVNSIINQSVRPEKVVIIDNNSNDGTCELLKEKKYLFNPLIHYKRLNKNIGGAGGFYEGIKEAQKFSPTWLWVMDDDTIPQKNCLEEMLKAQEEIEEDISYLASSVLGKNNEFMNVPKIDTRNGENGYPNWHRYLNRGLVKIKEATFVSLLINNKAVKKIGLPMKNYFIWGDDIEYTLRLTTYFANAYLVGNSIAIHKRKTAKSLTIYEEADIARIKLYYFMIRNNLINQKEYYGALKMFQFMFINQIRSLKVLIKPKCKYRIRKFLIIHKAIIAYILKRYDAKAFKNRLNYDVKYSKSD